ncbi:MAG TPA: T9SS type A sorting domain-containing protein, partial [Candidatus Kryptobacter bacterium]|nr:T9SS type A sorting domain-containing protein [Candidatus Kryptobacter bacterium]
TAISYELSANSYVTLKVYDVLGREVATLVNAVQKIGSYEVQFEGSRLASGVYFYRLMAGGNVITKKMVLVK